jgi:hypothetical protein
MYVQMYAAITTSRATGTLTSTKSRCSVRRTTPVHNQDRTKATESEALPRSNHQSDGTPVNLAQQQEPWNQCMAARPVLANPKKKLTCCVRVGPIFSRCALVISFFETRLCWCERRQAAQRVEWKICRARREGARSASTLHDQGVKHCYWIEENIRGTCRNM